jgi:hypothetical protein
MRWGVEVFYGSVKQILGATKMGSRAPGRACLELNWTMVAAAVLALMSVSALRRRRVALGRWSFAGALREARVGLHEDRAGRGPRRRGIAPRLAEALKDDYRRTSRKESRHRPVTKDTPIPIKPPRIIRATPPLLARAARTPLLYLAA